MNLTNFLVQPGPVRAEHKIVASLPAFGLSLKNTINSCKQTANKEAGVGPCLEGVFGTVMAFGGAASASKNLEYPLHRWADWRHGALNALEDIVAPVHGDRASHLG